jgi:hypothetical protein
VHIRTVERTNVPTITTGAKWLLAATLATACGATWGRSGYATSAKTVHLFYDDLDRYGRWVPHSAYRSVWVPWSSDYEPYASGRWVNSDQGLVWVSDEPFGWVTTHYGHWIREASYGWSWIPSRDWTPANVAFFDAGDAIGWAPVGPDGRVDEAGLHYVRWAQLTAPDTKRHEVGGGMDMRARSIRLDVVRPELLQKHGVSLPPPVTVGRADLDARLSLAEQRGLLAGQRKVNADIRRQEAEHEQGQLLEQLRRRHAVEMLRLFARLATLEDGENADLGRQHAAPEAYARMVERQNQRRHRDVGELLRRQQEQTDDELKRLAGIEANRR